MGFVNCPVGAGLSTLGHAVTGATNEEGYMVLKSDVTAGNWISWKCIGDGNCPSKFLSETEDTCAEGQDGIACANCLNDTYWSSKKQKCKKCVGSEALFYAIYILILLGVAVGVFYIMLPTHS